MNKAFILNTTTCVPHPATQKLLVPKWLSCFFIFLVVLASCKKSRNEMPAPAAPAPTSVSAPVPTTGTIAGKISPAGSLSYVKARNTQATVTDPSVIIPLNATSDAFTIGSLPAGTYIVSFTGSANYNPPAGNSLTVTVRPGEVMDLGTIAARPNMLSGIPFEGRATQTYASPLLNIASEGGSIGSSVGGVGGVGDRLFTLTMDDITGVGTYPCKGTITSAMTFRLRGYGAKTWSTNNPGGSGTLVVTSIDPVKKEIKGTFTATLVCNTAGVADVVINNGSFYFAY